MATLTDLGNAAWRLRKWVNNSNEERKMPANSALRTIDRFLSENNVEVVDPIGSKFDVGLAIIVVNNEAEGRDEESLIIVDTIKPIITIDGQVSQYGQVILGEHLPMKEDEKKELSDTSLDNNTIKLKDNEDITNQEKQPVTKEEWIIRVVLGLIVFGLYLILATT